MNYKVRNKDNFGRELPSGRQKAPNPFKAHNCDFSEEELEEEAKQDSSMEPGQELPF